MDLIRRAEAGKAHALATPLLTKADGTKFGKTETGTVWLDPAMTSPYAFHQFFLNAEDSQVIQYLKIFSVRDADEIAELEGEKAKVGAALCEPEAHSNPDRMRELAGEMARVEDGLAGLMDRWESLSGEIGELDEVLVREGVARAAEAEKHLEAHLALRQRIAAVQASINAAQLPVVTGELRACKRMHLLPGVLSALPFLVANARRQRGARARDARVQAGRRHQASAAADGCARWRRSSCST